LLTGLIVDRMHGQGSPESNGRAVRVLSETEQRQSEGTRRMAARLAELARQVRAEDSTFFSDRRVGMMRKRVAEAPDSLARLDQRLLLAGELLRAGQSEEALKELEETEALARREGRALPPAARVNFETQRALCHLRIAEQQNCQHHHNPESCLFPIRGGGVHQLTGGSRAAADILAALLETNPNDLRARWLLNVAHMTLGEYPDKVTVRWLMPPRLFESQYDIKRFPNVAGALGLEAEGLAGGAIVEDFDGDGFLDVATSSWGLADQLRLFRNNGNGTFTERTREAGIAGIVGGLNMVQTDYNNDGRPDIFVLRGGWWDNVGNFPNSLLRNNGDGTFDDVTEEAGMLSFHPTQTATWFDFDGDGWLDVFIGNESRPNAPHPCELYRNNGNGTFTECAARFGMAVTAYVKGVTSGDFNNDGRPDLYLSIRGGPNRLYRNDGPTQPGGTAADGWRFTDVAAQAGVTQPEYSFPTWFFDFDNDGWQDIFVAGYAIRNVGDIAADYLGQPHPAELPRLYRNNGDGTFADVTEAMGLKRVLYAMGSNFGDLDNDGWPDFYLGTGDPDLGTLIPNLMFRNDAGRRFQDVTAAGGFGHLQKGHGVAFADLDNDGDQDVYIDIGGAYPTDKFRNALFLNPGHGNHWLKLGFEGVKSNRPGIGVRIRAEVDTPQGPRSIYKTAGTGGSFGTVPLRQELGLGAAAVVRLLEVTWPATGKKQAFRDIPADRCYRIREDAPTPVPLPLKPLMFSSGENTGQ
jgi:hypothetical protein